MSSFFGLLKAEGSFAYFEATTTTNWHEWQFLDGAIANSVHHPNRPFPRKTAWKSSSSSLAPVSQEGVSPKGRKMPFSVVPRMSGVGCPKLAHTGTATEKFLDYDFVSRLLENRKEKEGRVRRSLLSTKEFWCSVPPRPSSNAVKINDSVVVEEGRKEARGSAGTFLLLKPPLISPAL